MTSSGNMLYYTNMANIIVYTVKFSFCISPYTNLQTSAESSAAKRQSLPTKQNPEGAFHIDLVEFIEGFYHLN